MSIEPTVLPTAATAALDSVDADVKPAVMSQSIDELAGIVTKEGMTIGMSTDDGTVYGVVSHLFHFLKGGDLSLDSVTNRRAGRAAAAEQPPRARRLPAL